MEGRYHGEPEWPPAPARVFQALVAGGSHSGDIDADMAVALRWLESLHPPRIAAPRPCSGQRLNLYVPNNDLDAHGGDPGCVATIRTDKTVRPRIFDGDIPLVYAWSLPELTDETCLVRICDLALDLYQLGRGVDMAWATAEVLDAPATAERIDRHPGQVFMPTLGATRNSDVLLCPRPGSLKSLTARHVATLQRFVTEGEGQARVQLFRQPPKARFAQVAYDSPPRHAVFDIRPAGQLAAFAPTPLSRIVRFTEVLRDRAATRLAEALPERQADIERALIGRRVEGLSALPARERIRLVALPSIGHEHVDRGIRRLLVEVPACGPLRADDVFWAFSGLILRHATGSELELTRTDDEAMLGHYGAQGAQFLSWRTVTPAALPTASARRRISPSRQSAEAKGAHERSREETLAARAVAQALRHANVHTAVEFVRVQREPFESNGDRAEAFASGTRFAPQRLWHVELTFREPMRGPLVLGDGRFLGLGLMAPAAREAADALAFRIVSGLVDDSRPQIVAAALRRAVMARFQEAIGDGRRLPPFVSGHDVGGGPEAESHLAFVFDPDGRRLLVVPPHVHRHRRVWPRERRYLSALERALAGFADLRASAAGRLRVERAAVFPEEDPLLAPSRIWVSRTCYVVNRHLRYESAAEAMARDLEASCLKLGLPVPQVTVLEVNGVPKEGLTGRAELDFGVAVPGPLLLGRTRHKGGGVFGHPPRGESREY